MMSSARVKCHMSHASEFRSSRGRTRIWSSVSPPNVRSAADILFPPTAAECTAACWERNSSLPSMVTSLVRRSVRCGNGRMPGGGIGDRVIVVGGHRAADADRADDPSRLDDRYPAPAEDELVA